MALTFGCSLRKRFCERAQIGKKIMHSGVDIYRYLKNFSCQEAVSYFPNPGNAGDSLIAYSTFQLFKDIGLKYRIMCLSDLAPSGQIVFCGGGGDWFGDEGQIRAVVEKIHRKASKVVILPSTITGNEDFLAQLGKNVDIFCRERISYEHVKKNARGANVFLSEDMAFYLKLDEMVLESPKSLASALMSESGRVLKGNLNRIGKIPSPKQMRRFLKREAKLFRVRKKNSGGVLNCFRTDKERTARELPEDNLDLSRYISYGVFNEAVTFLVSDQMLRFLNAFDTVKTNRLHIAIASAILGKKVDLYANSYYKNRAMFEYSMDKQYNNVVWKED